MKKYSKEELFKMPAIEVYKLVLSGRELKVFPPHFWSRPEAEKNAIDCFNYLIEEILHLDKSDIPSTITKKLLMQYSLSGMLGLVFNGSIYEMVNTTYPNLFKPWDFQRPPRGYWENRDNCIYAIKWLLEEKLKLTDDEIKEKYCANLFHEHRIAGALVRGFSGSPFKAIDAAYPGKFNEWDFSSTQKNFWANDENKIRATKWLIEEKLKFNDYDIKNNLTSELFDKHGLKGMLKLYNGSPYAAVNAAYPNRFHPWEFAKTPYGFYDNEKNRLDALRWLIEEKLKLTDDEIKEKVSLNFFKEHSLGGLVSIRFNGSPYAALNALYPGKFKQWELKQACLGLWQERENRVEAIRWLVEEKLQLTPCELKKTLSKKIFVDNGLEGLLNGSYNGSPVEAIKDAYPDEYKSWDFNRIPARFFNDKANRISATKWLIEDKLKYNKEQVLENIAYETFVEHGLENLIIKSNYCAYQALNEAYPGEYELYDFKRVKKTKSSRTKNCK